MFGSLQDIVSMNLVSSLKTGNFIVDTIITTFCISAFGYIYSKFDCPPSHIFVTTGVDLKKAMEKKESFMLAYYTEQERMKPIKIY